MSIQKFPGATCYYDGKNPTCTCPAGSEKQLLRANEMGPGNPSQDQYWCNYVSSNCTDKMCSCLTHNSNRNCLCPAGSKKVYVPVGTIPGFSRDYFYCCDQAGKPVGTGGRYPEICTAAATRASLASSSASTGTGTSTTMLDSPGVKVIDVSGGVSAGVSSGVSSSVGTTGSTGSSVGTPGSTAGTIGSTVGTIGSTVGSTGSGVGSTGSTGSDVGSTGSTVGSTGSTGSGVGTTGSTVGSGVGTTGSATGTGSGVDESGSGGFYPTEYKDSGDMILWYVFGMGLPLLLLVIFIIVVFLSKKSSQ